MCFGPSFQTSHTPLPSIRTLIIGYHRLNFLCSSNASSCIWNLVNFWKYDGDLFIKQSPLKFRHLKPKAISSDVRKPDETPTIIDKKNPVLYPNKNLDLSQTNPKPHTWSCRKEIAMIQSCWEYGAELKTTEINQCGFQVCAACRSASIHITPISWSALKALH